MYGIHNVTTCSIIFGVLNILLYEYVLVSLFILLLMKIWIVFSLGLSQIMLQEHFHNWLVIHVHAFLLGVLLIVECRDHRKYVYLNGSWLLFLLSLLIPEHLKISWIPFRFPQTPKVLLISPKFPLPISSVWLFFYISLIAEKKISQRRCTSLCSPQLYTVGSLFIAKPIFRIVSPFSFSYYGKRLYYWNFRGNIHVPPV